MANVSTGFPIGIVVLSKGQAIAKDRMLPWMITTVGVEEQDFQLVDGDGDTVIRCSGPNIFNPWLHNKAFNKLSVATTLAADSWINIYLR